jgi:dTDP-4-dehydrorhamnose reductase
MVLEIVMYLLTGGSGVLGTELQKQGIRYNFECWAPSSKELDITDDNRMSKFYFDNRERLQKMRAVVHCGAYTDVPGAETNKIRAIDININGTRNVSRGLCWPLGIPMVYISTDYVYPGSDGNYRETDRVSPVNFYAQTKYMGEAFLDEKDLIIRTSFKPNEPWPYPNAFDDLYTSADYVDVIAPKILDLIGNGESGIYNVGTERKTIYDLARRRNTKVKPMSKNDIKDVYLPSDVSMNLDKYNTYYDEQYGCDGTDCCPEQ